MKKSLTKKFISWLAGFYPNSFFYGSETHTKFNGILTREKSTSDGEKMSPLSQAALMMAIACSERMNVGDLMEAKFNSTTYKGEGKGSFKVIVERLKDD